MSAEVIATILSAVGVLIGVWKMVDGTRRELSAEIESDAFKEEAYNIALNSMSDSPLP